MRGLFGRTHWQPCCPGKTTRCFNSVSFNTTIVLIFSYWIFHFRKFNDFSLHLGILLIFSMVFRLTFLMMLWMPVCLFASSTTPKRVIASVLWVLATFSLLECLNPWLRTSMLSSRSNIHFWIQLNSSNLSCFQSLFTLTQDPTKGVRKELCHSLCILLEVGVAYIMPFMRQIIEFMLTATKDEVSIYFLHCWVWGKDFFSFLKFQA